MPRDRLFFNGIALSLPLALLTACAGSHTSLSNANNSPTPQAAPPSFSPAAGTYAAVQSVSLSDATAGAAIYYTTDGSTPTTSSNRYQTPISVSSSQTVNAIAALSGYSNSSVASAVYTINLPSPNTTVTVNQSQFGPALTSQIMGMNMAYWYGASNAAIIPAFQTAGIKAVRYPGGSGSDFYHWQTNTLCNGDYTAPNSSFASFTSLLSIPLNLDVAITVNYGTNIACNAGGDPAEAAAWVTAALNNGNNVSHWTVGNEEFGGWEEDRHAIPHDPTTYANAVASGYYPLMKAANPNTLVGVIVDGGYTATWDPVVLAHAKYDFVEYHFYPQLASEESDSFLVTKAAQQITSDLNYIKAELATAGHAETPIYVGEIGSVNTNPGVQTESITQALFAGQVLGEMMNAGVSRATWWIGFGGCSQGASEGNFSSSLYGWQNFGGYMVFSDGLPEYGCESAPVIPAGTLLPTARAYQLVSSVARDGEHALTVAVTGDTSNIRAYAATTAGATSLILFNLNESQSQTFSLALSGQTHSSSITLQTYDKAIYDQSKSNVWAGPASTQLGAQNLPLTLSLTPWSMNVVTIQP